MTSYRHQASCGGDLPWAAFGKFAESRYALLFAARDPCIAILISDRITAVARVWANVVVVALLHAFMYRVNDYGRCDTANDDPDLWEPKSSGGVRCGDRFLVCVVVRIRK